MAKQEIRNVAIIAHVDHGKTTLVDKMLRQAGAFRENQVVVERVMDSNPLERTPIVVINKIDRPGADPLRVHDEVLDLFIELEADAAQLDAPVVYASAREGVATMDMDVAPVDLSPLFDSIIRHVPPPPSDADSAFQMLISTIDHSPYLGRLGIGRIERGTVHVGDAVALLPLDTNQKSEQSRVTKLFTFEGLDRIEVPEASAGEIVALAGLEGVEIGLTVTDTEHPERLAGIAARAINQPGREPLRIVEQYLEHMLGAELLVALAPCV